MRKNLSHRLGKIKQTKHKTKQDKNKSPINQKAKEGRNTIQINRLLYIMNEHTKRLFVNSDEQKLFLKKLENPEEFVFHNLDLPFLWSCWNTGHSIQ